MKIDEDFIITESKFGYKGEDDLFGVEILTGDFKGIKYTYGTLKFPDEDASNAEDGFVISFDYTVREGKIEEEDKDRFENTIGTVLHSVLYDSLNKAEQRHHDEIRNDNSQTPD